MHTPRIHIMRSKARGQCIFHMTLEPTLIARQSSLQWEERNKKEDKKKKIACIAVLAAPRKERKEWRRKMVSQTRKVWRRIRTEEDKNKKIENEVDCVAFWKRKRRIESIKVKEYGSIRYNTYGKWERNVLYTEVKI